MNRDKLNKMVRTMLKDAGVADSDHYSIGQLVIDFAKLGVERARITALLGLPESATVDDVVGAIERLKVNAKPYAAHPEPDWAGFTDGEGGK